MDETEEVLPTKTFYGKRKLIGKSWGSKLIRKEHELKSLPIPLQYKSQLAGPSLVWEIFRKQDDAFAFVHSHPCELKVIAFESDSFFDHHGQRMFLATTYQQFWHFYQQLQQSKRHHYEIIPEDAVCHLYFDLEYQKDFNPDADGDLMVKILMQYTCSCLDEHFNIKCTEKDILRLDACTKEKFSSHLIFHFPQAVFKDNIHAGNFVQHIMARLKHTNPISTVESTTKNMDSNGTPKGKTTISEKKSEVNRNEFDEKREQNFSSEHITSPAVDDLKLLFVKDKDKHDRLFCDMGVYTRNRHFRFYLSSKMHKNNPLLLADDDQYFRQKEDSKVSEREIFDASLISNVSYNKDLRILSFEKSKDSNKFSVMPRSKKSNEEKEFLEGRQQSPYPDVDIFISNKLSKDGIKGYIRQWTYFTHGELLLYEIAKNRWCENIGRQHKSNNIMFIADLKRGVYYQKCHDPDCKAIDFKSEELQLPEIISPFSMFSTSDNEMGDEELLKAAEQIKQIEDDDDICDSDIVDAAISAEASFNLESS